jgi:hypothetical protein
MKSVILENDGDPSKGNPAEPVQVPAEPAGQPVEPQTPPEPATAPEEPTVEVDGEKLTLSEIKKLRDERKQDADWKKSNTLKAEENARQARELQELAALKPLLQQRPDVLQQLFTAAPQRDFTKELETHYSTRPDDFAEANVKRDWELKRDQLLYQKSVIDAQLQVREQVQQQAAFNHNNTLDIKAKEKYGTKINPSEFQNMVDWIRGHIKPNNGLYPEDAYDIAYKNLHEDKYLQDLKVNATQKIVDTLGNPNPPKGGGVRQNQPVLTQEDEGDGALVAALKSKSKGKWHKLP